MDVFSWFILFDKSAKKNIILKLIIVFMMIVEKQKVLKSTNFFDFY